MILPPIAAQRPRTPATPGGGLERFAADADPVLSLGDANGAPGAEVDVTLRGENLADWAGGELVIVYDIRLVERIVGVQTMGLAAGFVSQFHDDGAGLVRITLAQGAPVSDSGALLTLRLKLKASAPPGSSAALVLADVRLNDVLGRDFATSALQRTIGRRSGRVTIGQVRLYLPLILRH